MSHVHFGSREVFPGKDCPTCRPSGEQLKAEGQARVDEAEDPVWRACAFKTIETLPPDVTFDADYIREVCGDPFRPNSMGSVFTTAKRQGLIEVERYETAVRPSRHVSLMRVWRRL